MKKLLILLLSSGTILFSGCFETTVEVTLNEDGSGTYVNTIDMSAMMGPLKELVKNDSAGMDEENVDTSYSLASKVDSIPGLSPDEKTLLATGNLHTSVNFKEEKSLTVMSFPLSNASDIGKISQLCETVFSNSIEGKMNEASGLDSTMPKMPKSSSINDYYTTSYSNGVLERKLNKKKYDSLGEDEYLQGMKEAAAMGTAMTLNYVFNLPRPAKKAEGKNVKLSADKKKVTIKADIEDFYDDGASGEFRIEY